MFHVLPARAARRELSRRHFLRVCGAAASGIAVAGCSTPGATAPAVRQVGPDTLSPSVAAGHTQRPKVAVAQAMSYDRAEVRRQVRQMIDQLGGLQGVLRSRDRVVIKTNLTGGVTSGALTGVAPIESFITHPEVVRGLAEAVKEAGARDVTIVESVYEWPSYVEWGYEQMARDLDVKLLDLNQSAPYTDFTKRLSGADALLYKELTVNPILEECDVFMSVAKMKCHYTAGITLSMKNLVGIVPMRLYRLSSEDNHRSALHGSGDEGNTRIPRVIVDLNRARPIHFALIDGIKSVEGGEGPWISTMRANTPHLLVAGVSPLATDTVATALMGFDATAKPLSAPFVRGDNHFALAAANGLGTNRLADIDVLGAPINDVAVKFRTA